MKKSPQELNRLRVAKHSRRVAADNRVFLKVHLPAAIVEKLDRCCDANGCDRAAAISALIRETRISDWK